MSSCIVEIYQSEDVIWVNTNQASNISEFFRPRNRNTRERDPKWPIFSYIKVKVLRYRPGVAQRVGRGIALLFHDRGTRRGWVVSSTPRPHFTPGEDPVPILLEAGSAPGPVWTGGKSRPHRDLIPDHPTRSQSLYLLSYPSHYSRIYVWIYYRWWRETEGRWHFISCMYVCMGRKETTGET